MQSASSFEGTGSPFGTLRVLPQFQEAHGRNSTHIQEVYQNLPQLQRAMFLPITQKSYETQNHIPTPAFYPEQAQQTFNPTLYAKLQANNQKPPKQRYEHALDADQIMSKRNGNGWGGGGGDAGHHHHHHGNSPALQALGLLAFMFFLQLIQNSLQNNRQMLALSAAAGTGATGAVAGRENRYFKGYSRNKRSIREDKRIQKIHGYDAGAGIHHKSFTAKPDNNYDQATFKYPLSLEQNNLSSAVHNNKKTERSPGSIKNNPIEILRSSSIHCCQLLACKIGESIYDRLDTTTGFMFRMLGATILPRTSPKTWTGRLLRAFDKGWKKESCENLYRNCGALYNFFYNTTNNIQPRRKKIFH